MPDRTSRSRTRTTIQSRNRPIMSRNGGNGNTKQLPIIGAFIAIALIAVVGAIVLLTKHNSIPLLGHGTSAPNHMLTGSASATPESSSDLPQDTMGMMDTFTPSELPAPSDTPASDLIDSTQHNDSASEPSATQTHDETVDTSTSATIEIKPITGKADVANYLSLRSDATDSASVIAKIPKGSSFTILQVSKNPAWLEVDHKGKYGFVLAKYVIIEGDPSNQICTITSMTVNVRHGAGKDKEIIGELLNGDTIVVTEQKTANDGTWYKIAVGDLVGYISAQYCRLSTNG